MRNVELPKGTGIYFIQIGNYGYVGQTKDLNTRLGQHINNAYDGDNDGSDSEKGLYWKMKIHRLQDLNITIYPASGSPAFGIPNFDEKFNAFLDEWEPVGKRFSRNSAVTNESLRLDFAEIYHIMYHIIKDDCKLTNIDFGGQSQGWTSRKSPASALTSNGETKIKVLTRHTPPQEAYQTFLRGAIESMNFADATTQIYNDLFDDDWASIFNSKYLPLIRSYETATYRQSFVNDIKSKKLTRWSVFFEKKCVPKIIEDIPKWVQQSLNDKGVSSFSKVKKLATAEMSTFVYENFLKPREDMARKMLEWIFKDKGYPSTTISMVGKFDFTQLQHYIGNTLSSLIVNIGNEAKLTDNTSRLTNFKPVRFSVVWKSRLHKDASETHWLLNNLSVKGKKVDETWLRYRSFLLFNKFMKRAKEVNIHVEPVFSNTMQKNYVPMYRLEPQDWLSTRLHRIYAQQAPGYSSNWYEFYRPMVSLWRTYEKRNEFEKIPIGDGEFLGYKASGDDALIMYKHMKNFVDNVTELGQLKLY